MRISRTIFNDRLRPRSRDQESGRLVHRHGGAEAGVSRPPRDFVHRPLKRDLLLWMGMRVAERNY
jgi:hypothetical protein